MDAYRWLPPTLILANERAKLALLRLAVRLAPGEVRAAELLREQEAEVEGWREIRRQRRWGHER